MDITSQHYISFTPPLPHSAEAVAARVGEVGARGEVSESERLTEDEEQLRYDHYLPSDPLEDDGFYTRESVVQKMRAAQEAAFDSSARDEFSSIQNDPNVSSQSFAPGAPNGVRELDEGDKELIERLRQRDQEVRLHEQSHAAIAGKYAAGPPSYSYQMGPDGKMYAIGGSLAIDTGKEADPVENRNKARILQAAALGVEEPSAADAMVAMQASNLMQ